jgi:uncharacterized membrane protein SirB2
VGVQVFVTVMSIVLAYLLIFAGLWITLPLFKDLLAYGPARLILGISIRAVFDATLTAGAAVTFVFFATAIAFIAAMRFLSISYGAFPEPAAPRRGCFDAVVVRETASRLKRFPCSAHARNGRIGAVALLEGGGRMDYFAIKSIHVSCVALSLGLFASRGAWMLASGRPLWRWLRVVPHLVDTLLLASGLALAYTIHQYPFVNSPWLTAKVVGLVVYIGLGVMVCRAPFGRAARWALWAGALLVFAYIVSVALTKRPEGLLLWL